jgi:beta-galactosidase
MLGIGVCYYPEQWSEDLWEKDCIKMKALGILIVRIGEFSWSKIEAHEFDENWEWLDKIMNLMQKYDLKVILGTPTATPPAWLIRKYPQILAHDREGRPREFGSRRHYCFSSEIYLQECQRIVTSMASRYGQHPSLYGWQTDNEYGCHDTVVSYSPAAQIAFQNWLKVKYETIESLNRAWGNIFWSMEYSNFHEIGLPNLTVTESNPSHRLDFQRFSSDQVLKFNHMQCQLLRKYSPTLPITHNMMGMITDYDHYALGEQLDFACWDSYPQGFTLDRMRITTQQQQYYLETGHPDIAAFHHDLYRSVGHGRWWVMEQQPGPVNWAPYNPIPSPGMIRLWSWEAFAHGAECVTYFRWRQCPFAQEQMHAGLLLPNSHPSPCWKEIEQVVTELDLIHEYNLDSYALEKTSEIALVFDYESDWIVSIQPQGATASVVHTALSWYSAVRSLGYDIDIISPKSRYLNQYKVILIPCQPVITQEFLEAIKASAARPVVLFGPRCGSKTTNFSIPENLPPGPLQEMIPFQVAWVASLPPSYKGHFVWDNKTYDYQDWKEQLVETETQGVIQSSENYNYLTVLPESKFIGDWVVKHLEPSRRGQVNSMPEGARWRTRGPLQFAFHFGTEPWRPQLPEDAVKVFGPDELHRADSSCWYVKG